MRLLPDGSVVVRSATQDLGTGTYTVMTQVAADALGVPVDQVRFELGDSRLPKAPGAGGSQSAASVAPAVQAAGLAMRDKLIELAIADPRSFAYRADAAQITVVDGWLRSRHRPAPDRPSPMPIGGEPIAALLARNGGPALETRAEAKPGAEREQYSMHSFGAVFAEVRVDAELGIVRVPRITAAYGVGNVLNAKTARSQMLGGIVWGVGMALLEESVRDPRDGRIVNAQPRRIPRAGQRRHRRDRHRVRRRERPATSIRSASRASARSASPACRRRSPTPSSTPPASAFAICRSRSTSCSELGSTRRVDQRRGGRGRC